MRKLIYLVLTVLIVACSSDDSNEPNMIDRIIEQKSWKSSFDVDGLTYSYGYFRASNNEFGYDADSYILDDSPESCYRFNDPYWSSGSNPLNFTVIELTYDVYKYTYDFIYPDESDLNTTTNTWTIDVDGNLNGFVVLSGSQDIEFLYISNPTDVQVDDLDICD